jgi:basic amino acid/polyamine antiporter, APA family
VPSLIPSRFTYDATRQLGCNTLSEHSEAALQRSLGPVNLVLLGIGCIIGAGVYVMTGVAAANYAGPAVVLSFALAGFACAFAALCYAELSTQFPVSGSAYSYAYGILGQEAAWAVGWLLLLEYGVSAAGVAVGWSASVSSLLQDYDVVLPHALTSASIHASPTPNGRVLSFLGGANVLAAGGVLAIAGWLLLGVRRMAAFNAVAVVLKVGILLVFVAIGIFYIHPSNWHPFIPPNEGGSRYGTAGVIRGASAIFFAYIGFEAVSTAAAESRNPQRNIPIGILGSLVACTIIYIIVAAVLTGIVPFRELGGAAPIAFAATRIGLPWFSLLIKIGSIAGLTSVMLVLLYGQSRILMSMARDGFLPELFCKLDPARTGPVRGTVVLGFVIAALAALLPIELLGDLVSLGTATAFAVVCLCTVRLRRAQTGRSVPFRIPGGASIPIIGVVASLAMTVPVILDMIDKARRGDSMPATILVSYFALGLITYTAYVAPKLRRRRSVTGTGPTPR